MWCSGPGRSDVRSAPAWPGCGLEVRAVSRHRPLALLDAVDWRAADAIRPRRRHRRGQGRIGHLPMPERAVHELAGALPAAAAGRAERSRTQRRAPGEPREPLRLWPDRGQADDRGSPAGGDDRQGPDPSGHDRGAARRRRRRSGPYRHRAGVGLLRRRRHRDDARRARLRQRPGRQARRLPRQPRPAPHLQLRPGRRGRSGHPRYRRARRRRSVAPAGPGDRHDPRGPRARRRRGRTPGRRSLGAQARSCAPSGCSTR